MGGLRQPESDDSGWLVRFHGDAAWKQAATPDDLWALLKLSKGRLAVVISADPPFVSSEVPEERLERLTAERDRTVDHYIEWPRPGRCRASVTVMRTPPHDLEAEESLLTGKAIQAAVAAVTPLQPERDSETARRIIAAAAATFHLEPDDLTGPSRAKPALTARMVAVTLVRARTTMSWPAIGRAFNRDHTTVLHAAQRVLATPLLLSYAAAVEATLTNPELPFGSGALRPLKGALDGPADDRTVRSD